MTTYISLASSDSMLPLYDGDIRRTILTPKLFRGRLERVACVSALNKSHVATIDAVKRRYGLELPLPESDAPQIRLEPGDELFIAQAQFPRRLKEGERYSDDEVNAAPISFRRWRVPASIGRRTPSPIPQIVYDRIIDDAYAIALWRGEDYLKGVDELRQHYHDEIKEYQEAGRRYFNMAKSANQAEKDNAYYDQLLEAGDVLRYALILHFRGEDHVDETLKMMAFEHIIINIMVAKYDRRASGAGKDLAEERSLAAKILGVK